MAALVVYESMFGNTEQVARAVAEGIATLMPVDVVEVGQAPDPADADVDLLVVGAPTHAFGLSRASTRADAARLAPPGAVPSRTGVREWLAAAGPCTCPAAAFDTHVSTPDLPGHAGRAAGKRLRRLGCSLVVSPESFAVHGKQGPLLPGELERARDWGERLADMTDVRLGAV